MLILLEASVLLQEIDSYLLSKVKGIVKIFQTTYSSTNVFMY